MHKRVAINDVIYPALIVVAALIALAIYFLFIYNKQDGILQKLNLLPKEESYTELFIDDHQTLPNYLAPGRVATASFTLRNYEHKNEHYKFLITKTLGKDTETIGSGSADVAHNQTKSIEFHYGVATTEAKTRIEVLLPEKKQSIHFYVNSK
jgi:hypothetical protein